MSVLSRALLEERAEALSRCVRWTFSSTRDEVEAAAKAGDIDRPVFSSSGEGFTLAAALCLRPEALEWAAQSGWRAEKPCVFALGARSKAEAWLPIDAIAYELTPRKLHLAQSARALRVLISAGIKPGASNPLAESALHGAARSAIRDCLGNDRPQPILQALLLVPSMVDTPDAGGRAPLHVARGAHNIGSLLRAGADPMAKDARGVRAIDVILATAEGAAAWSMHERDQLEGCSDAVQSIASKRL